MTDPLLTNAYLSVWKTEKGEFEVFRSNVKGLGDVRSPLAGEFRKALETKVFTEHKGIQTIRYTEVNTKGVFPPTVERPAEPSAESPATSPA